MIPKRPAPRSAPEEVHARIAIVADIMARGQWLGRATAKKLADEWGVELRTVRDYSRMASKLIHSGSLEEVDEIRADTIAKLTIIAAKSEQAQEYRAATGALEVRAKVAGVVSSGVTINNTVIQSLTVDQIRAAPAVQEVLGALADSWRLVAAELRRLSQGDGDIAGVLAAARAHERVILGRDDADVVEALPGGEESE